MPGLKESLKIPTLAVTALVALGHSAVEPVSAEAKCSVPQAVKRIKDHVVTRTRFRQEVLEPTDGGLFLTAFARGRHGGTTIDDSGGRQIMSNPLVIKKCTKGQHGEPNEMYVGVTNQKRRPLGRRFDVGHNTGLYLNVVDAGKVVLQEFDDDGPPLSGASLPHPRRVLRVALRPTADPSIPTDDPSRPLVGNTTFPVFAGGGYRDYGEMTDGP